MTKIVGILNITPDSFSDGGRYDAPKNAVARIEQLFADGADIVDIGAESTRPNATPLSADEEWERLAPLFSLIDDATHLSLDTRHATNTKRALDKGFGMINDVSGFTQRTMIDTLRGYHAKLVMMHSLTVPADKNITLAEDVNVIHTLLHWSQARINQLIDAGISQERIIFDAGIGFGKTAAQSLDILARIDELKTLEIPLYVGHSRKSCLGENRDEATLVWSQKLIASGVDYLRVHDVKSHRKLIDNK